MTTTGIQLPSAVEIPHLIAGHIIKSSSRGSPLDAHDLAGMIAEVTLQTQIYGASMLHLTIIDPDWAFQTSGMLEVDEDGLLDTVEVNFPESSNSWWRLCMVEGGTDYTQANVTLTFEDRIVGYLRDMWGAKIVKPGTTTRAQFVKQLVNEVGRRDPTKGVTPIRFVCPSLNVKQPVAVTATSQGAAQVDSIVSKDRGIGYGATLTVGAAPITKHQIDEANALLKAADDENAGTVAAVALVFAGIAESRLGANPGTYVPNALGFWGVLQGKAGTVLHRGGSAIDGPWPDPHDTTGQARSFLKGGKGFQGGGAIALSRKISDPAEIAVKVEVPSIWPDNAYAKEAGYSFFASEAKALVAAYGNFAGASQGQQDPAHPISDVTQLTRGTVQNPDESSWDCIQRLAQEVNWYGFSNANTLYYMDGPDLRAQKPAYYIKLDTTDGPRWSAVDANTNVRQVDVVETLTYTFDNTAFDYQQTHKKKGKIQRKSRIAKPQTPAGVQLNLICEWDEAAEHNGLPPVRAGDVIVFHHAGPISNRWIVADATRNVLGDTFTQLTLIPPTEPLKEPQGNLQPETPITSGTAEGYVNPFGQIKSLKPLRIDMGVDYGGHGTIVALGDGTIFAASTASGWPGGGFVGLTLANGNYKGKHVYHAESVSPLVKVGQKVKAGDPIALMHGDSFPFTESGWASGSGYGTLASALKQDAKSQGASSDPGGWTSAAGADFNQLLIALGVVSGISQGKSHGKMPADWPGTPGAAVKSREFPNETAIANTVADSLQRFA